MPLPTMVVIYKLGSMKKRYFLLMKNTSGNFNLFKNSLTDLNKSNVQKALFSPKLITGLKVQPYLKAYLMNPFLLLRYSRIQSGDVKQAYQYPPGTRPMFFPCCIRLLMFWQWTALPPQSLRMSPKNGALNPKRLPSPVKSGMPSSPLFMLSKIAA